MALLDDLSKVIEGVDKIAKDGVPISLKHELDAPTVSYFALMAFLVVIGAVVLIGVKDIIVHRIIK